jgi:hypothetical protein
MKKKCMTVTLLAITLSFSLSLSKTVLKQKTKMAMQTLDLPLAGGYEHSEKRQIPSRYYSPQPQSSKENMNGKPKQLQPPKISAQY